MTKKHASVLSLLVLILSGLAYAEVSGTALDCICILQSRDPDQADKILTELQVNPEFLRTQEYRRAIAYLASPLLRTYRSKLENRHQHPGTYVKEKIEEILSSLVRIP